MSDEKNSQTSSAVQPHDHRSLNSSAEKVQQGPVNFQSSGRAQDSQSVMPERASDKGQSQNQAPIQASQAQQSPSAVGQASSEGVRPPRQTQQASQSPQMPYGAQMPPQYPASQASYASQSMHQATPPDPAAYRAYPSPYYPVPPAPIPTMSNDPYAAAYGFEAFPSPDGDFAMPDAGKKKGNVLIIGVVACIIAIVILIIALLVIEFKPFGLFSDDFTAEPPSDIQIKKEFEDSTLPKLDLSVFRYVDTSDLEMTDLGDYDAGTVQYSGTGKDRKASCEATATATYENDSVMIVQPLYITLTYDKDDQSWTGANIRDGTIEASPLGPPDASMIADNITNILKSYDSAIAALYADAEISEEAVLNDKGGTIVFTLTKTPATPEEGTEPMVCTVNSEISWNDSLGWVVKISSVDGDIGAAEAPASAEDPAAADPNGGGTPPAADASTTPNASTPPSGGGGASGGGGTGGSTGGGGTGATTITTETEVQVLQLVCNTGDLVEIPGTIHFDNGRVLLRTDEVIRVILNGAVYTVNYFELQGTGSWTNGQHTVIIGTLSPTGALHQAPLVLSF